MLLRTAPFFRRIDLTSNPLHVAVQVLSRAPMKNTALASVAILSLLALTSVACSPVVSEPKAPMQPDVETSTTSLTSAEAMPAAPLPPNNAPLEGRFRGTPEGAATSPPSATAPAKPGVQPLAGWSYP